jgi:hypothetical protein
MKRKSNYHEVTVFPNGRHTTEYIGNTSSGGSGSGNYTCCGFSHACMRWTAGTFVLLSAFAVIAVAIVAYLSTSNVIANQRMCFYATSANGVGKIKGMTQWNTNERWISWNYITYNMSNPITSLIVYGPVQDGAQDGGFYLALCGPPSTFVCITNGTIYQTNPGGYSLTNFIDFFRAYPYAFYLNGTTSLYPNLDFRADFVSCGRP